ncbi:MAG: hypothetical protein QXO15_08800 [Nitrososphaerota archaeon]
MREYILTPREREILKTYIESGIKLNGFSVLALRLKRVSKTLLEDMELVKTALEKMEKEIKEKC